MAASRRTRILIVDDSAVMRSLLRSVVSTDAGLEVAGTAADGASALNCLEILHPDLILLDIEMPVMDGLATLRKLRGQGHRMPVIVCSSRTQRGARGTIEALAGGATDYVAKPTGQSSREAAVRALAENLVPKIHALTGPSQGQPQTVFPGAVCWPPMFPVASPPMVRTAPSLPAVLAIGASTGGPEALDVLLPALPVDFPLPVLVVQHMPELFTGLFAERLNGRCHLRVCEAAEGEPVRAGAVYIARGNWHMEVLAGSPATLHLSQGPLENHCRPAVDVLFRSVAGVYGAGVLAVVLTGMGCDGMNGCRAIRGHDGSVLVQDQATSTVWGMPGAIVHAGLANKALPLGDLAPEILRIAGRAHSEARELPLNLDRSVV
jgi:two-component system chemotaxis response regulator CheB